MPNLTDNLLIDTANQSAEALVHVGLEGLKIADKGVRAIDNAVSLRSLGGTFTKHLPKHKILDTSYGDIRSAGVEKVREWNKTAGFVADVVAPNVVDLAFGAGKITKGLKGIKHGISLTPDILKIARNNIDDLISPKVVATAGGSPMSLRMARNTAEQFGTANPLMIKGTKEVATEIATDSKVRRAAVKVDKNRDTGFDVTDEYYRRNLKGDDLELYEQTSKYGAAETLTGAMIGKNRGRAPFSPKLSPHHMSELSFDAKTLNRADSDELIGGLNQLDIFPGNHPRNFIGMYGDNTAAVQSSLTVQLHELLGGDRSLREIKDFLKKLPEGQDLAAKTLRGKPVDEVKDLIAGLKPTRSRGWEQFFKGTRLDGKGLGYLEGKVDLPKAIFSTEHNEMHRQIINKLSSTTEIEALLKSGKWQNLNTNDALRKLATNQLHKQNVAMNISSLRLKEIQKSMGKTNGDPNDWTDIITYMAKNPHTSAMSGWHKRVSKGGANIYKQLGLSQQDLIRDLDPKRAELVAKVFGMEQVPQTTGKIRAFLSKTGLEKKLSIANN
tara:strand:+ start:528 stop:2189 length:1662 start_codon:yes stop_codon:yes gene_type:complete